MTSRCSVVLVACFVGRIQASWVVPLQLPSCPPRPPTTSAKRGFADDRLAADEEKTSSSSRTAKQTVCVLESETFPHVATNIAERLELPLLSPKDHLLQHHDAGEKKDELFHCWTHALSVEPYAFGNVQDYAVGIRHLEERPNKKKKKRKPPLLSSLSQMKPFYIDFYPPSTSRLGRRTAQEAGPDLLLQAIAPRKGRAQQCAVIYDLTAGWGQDSLLMAHHAGVRRVHMVERDPIVAILLEDAVRRLKVLAGAADDPVTKEIATTLSNCLSLECGDAVSLMETLLLKQPQSDDSSALPDIVYLDPMFPTRKKSASVKKNMQILHSLLDSQTEVDDDTARQRQDEALLRVAHRAAQARVVVKRPVHAPSLLPDVELRPDYKVMGSINRWDVYVKS